jgi:hypothetical protein
VSSSRRRFRRSDLLLLVLPALLTFFILVLPSHGSLTSSANPRIGAKQRIEAIADTIAPVGGTSEAPAAQEPSRDPALPARPLHQIIGTAGDPGTARAPSAS